MLSLKARRTLAQLLAALSIDARKVILAKHLDSEPWQGDLAEMVQMLIDAADDQVAAVLSEVVGDSVTTRTYASPKYPFDNRLKELERTLLAEGWQVRDGQIHQVDPMATTSAPVLDDLQEALGNSGLEKDGDLTLLLNGSNLALAAEMPEYNTSTTKARILLETICRRGAQRIAVGKGIAVPVDTWGSCLSWLKTQDVITPSEEAALASFYTLASPGAHVPKGLSDGEWARLVRAFALSGSYFLLRQLLTV